MWRSNELIVRLLPLSVSAKGIAALALVLPVGLLIAAIAWRNRA